MSEIGLDIGDWRYVPMIEQYMNMASMSISRKSIYAILAEEYHISESSVKRVIRRMLRRVRM
jgi:Mor family transcriptional regulator